MVVEGVIRSALEARRDDIGTTDQNGKDLVLLSVCLGLVEGQQQQGAVHKGGVVEERCEPVPLPNRSKGDVGVVAIIGHVGCDERPLGQGIGFEIVLEVVEVLDQGQTGSIGNHTLKQNERVVLAHVHVGKGLLVGVVEALEARIRHTLLVLGPRDALGVEQINNGGDVGREEVEIIIVHAEVVTGGGSAVVWLGRMGCGEVVSQGDALGGQVLLVWVAGSSAVVDVLEPYLVETLERLALDI